MTRRGGHDEALHLYREILDARPDEPKWWRSYGHVLKKVGDQQDSIPA